MGSFMKFGDSLSFFEIFKTAGSLILIFLIKKTQNQWFFDSDLFPNTQNRKYDENERIAPHTGINNNWANHHG